MRATLFDNGDFATLAQLRPVAPPVGGYCLTLVSRRRLVRDPQEEQVRFQGFFDGEGLQALADLIAREVRS